MDDVETRAQIDIWNELVALVLSRVKITYANWIQQGFNMENSFAQVQARYVCIVRVTEHGLTNSFWHFLHRTL